MDRVGQLTATPVYDGVLGDRLQAAHAAVDRARQEASRFQAALDQGQAAALREACEQRARVLVDGLAREQHAVVDDLRRQLRWARDQLAVAAGVIAVLEARLAGRPEVAGPEPSGPAGAGPEATSEPPVASAVRR